jgi:hypothetical protein
MFDTPVEPVEAGPVDPFCAQSEDAWGAWCDAQIDSMLTPTYATDAGGVNEVILDRDEVNKHASAVFAQLDSCRTQAPARFAASTSLGQRTQNLYSFTRALHWMTIVEGGKTTHQLGMELSDQQYADKVKDYVALPDLLGSQDVLRLMDSASGYQAVVQRIQQQNATLPNDDRHQWRVVPFLAQFITTIDTGAGGHPTYGRLLIYAPSQPGPSGTVVDKWVLFGIVTPDMAPDSPMHNVSVFASVKKSETDVHTQTFFMDNWREKLPDGTIKVTPTPYLEHDNSKNCYDCHKLSILPFHAEIPYSFDTAGRLVPAPNLQAEMLDPLNRRLRTYGPPDFVYLDALAYGPPLGPSDRTRTVDFVRSCSGISGITDQSAQNILDNMTCADCHNRSALGPINYLQAVRSKRDVTAFKQHVSMIETFIESGLMPPRSSLSATERTALFRCLQSEYFDLRSRKGLLVDWLRGQSVTYE